MVKDSWSKEEDTFIKKLLTTIDNIPEAVVAFQKNNLLRRSRLAIAAQIYSVKAELIKSGQLTNVRRRIGKKEVYDKHHPNLIIGEPVLKKIGKISYLSYPVSFLKTVESE